MGTVYFSSFQDLSSEIARRAEMSLSTTVGEELKETLRKSAVKNVHPDSASSRQAGGITDPRNIVINVNCKHKSIDLIVKDIAKPAGPLFTPFDSGKDDAVGGTMFANWIERGEWVELWDSEQRRAARPFVAPAQSEVNSHSAKIVALLKKGMNLK